MLWTIDRDTFAAYMPQSASQRLDAQPSRAVASLKSRPSIEDLMKPIESRLQNDTPMQTEGQAAAATKVLQSTVSLAQVDPAGAAASPFSMRASASTYESLQRARANLIDAKPVSASTPKGISLLA